MCLYENLSLHYRVYSLTCHCDILYTWCLLARHLHVIKLIPLFSLIIHKLGNLSNIRGLYSDCDCWLIDPSCQNTNPFPSKIYILSNAAIYFRLKYFIIFCVCYLVYVCMYIYLYIYICLNTRYTVNATACCRLSNACEGTSKNYTWDMPDL